MDVKKINEKQIKDALLTNTDASPKLKEEIWSEIDKEIFSGPTKDKKNYNREEVIKMKKRNGFLKYVVTAAVLAVLFIGLQTQPGHALISQIREMFAPEQDVTQIIEGIEEETKLELTEGKETSYVIYVDEERYKMTREDDSDVIVPKEPLGDAYPEVSMEIKHIQGEKPEAIIGDLESSFKEEFDYVTNPQKVNDPINSHMIYGESGSEWDSPVKRVYVIDSGDGGSFVVTQRFFLEAYEGHGARFNEMLKEFHIIDE
ncbi:hypothetical protein [Natranaerofaba carboxydovora]|uniref:hypothetical protein n=1 Tax=Natranaerofaba carboxydovora TaxID=2742683 RepID=UPI001F12C7D2|nr:hypothetical protein [Natranaerofaba carboxydovora]UMZ73045.1 hypothetical protein ACONDI_00591 [Natranaerofaba carboxydovora]